ncbi:MAG: ATP-dependent metallopeptidase FtsH/Yme1/Tma family protein, partial [Nocardioidaceae bacterium]
MWIVLAAIGVLIVFQYLGPNGGYTQVDTSEMAQDITSGQVKQILFIDGDQQMRATLDDGKKVSATWIQGTQQSLFSEALKAQKAGTIKSVNGQNPQPSLLWSLLATFGPILLIVLVFVFLMSQVQGGGGRVMQFAKSKAKLISKDMPKTTFADVAGCEEAIEELGEIKEFLQ